MFFFYKLHDNCVNHSKNRKPDYIFINIYLKFHTKLLFSQSFRAMALVTVSRDDLGQQMHHEKLHCSFGIPHPELSKHVMTKEHVC